MKLDRNSLWIKIAHHGCADWEKKYPGNLCELMKMIAGSIGILFAQITCVCVFATILVIAMCVIWRAIFAEVNLDISIIAGFVVVILGCAAISIGSAISTEMRRQGSESIWYRDLLPRKARHAIVACIQIENLYIDHIQLRLRDRDVKGE